MPGIDIFKYALHENEAFEIEKSYVYQLYFSKRSLSTGQCPVYCKSRHTAVEGNNKKLKFSGVQKAECHLF